MENAAALQELAPQPSYQLGLRVVFGISAGVGALLGLVWLASGSGATSRTLELGVYLLFLGILGSLYQWLWLANTRLLIAPGGVGYRNVFGQSRFWRTSDVARAVQITVVYRGRGGSQPRRYLLLVGSDGRCLRKVRAAAWSEGSLDAFAAATGRTPEYLAGYTPQDANREFPGSVGWMYAHPGLAGAVTAAIVASIGAGFLWWGLTR